MDDIDERTSLQARLRAAFESEMPIPEGTELHLAATARETLQRTGNFVRAQLAYGMGRSYGLADEAALRLAIAIEYFHTSSLLFDDLPSMDDATHRRGALCVHHIYGEGATILTALALINRAYALLWRVVASAARPPRQAEALDYVEKYLGLGGLLNGQSHDLCYARLPLAERSPQKVAMGKTVGLIRLSLVLPAMVGGADARAVRLLDRLAVFWGLAYQVLDDLKDVLHEPERAGKTTARDTDLDRPNAALSMGTEAAMQRLERLAAMGSRVIGRLEESEPELACLEAARRRLDVEVAGLAGELQGTSR